MDFVTLGGILSSSSGNDDFKTDHLHCGYDFAMDFGQAQVEPWRIFRA